MTKLSFCFLTSLVIATVLFFGRQSDAASVFGRTSALGAVASSDEICVILNHPLFGQNLNWIGYNDTTNGELLYDREGRVRQWFAAHNLDSYPGRSNFQSSSFNPDFVLAANASLLGCLRTLDSTRLQVISKHLLPMLGKDHAFNGNPPCFSNNNSNNADEMRNAGAFWLSGMRGLCVDFSYSGWDRGSINGGTSPNHTLLMLVLRDAHPALMAIFDNYYQNLLPRVAATERANGAAQAAEQKKASAEEAAEQAQREQTNERNQLLHAGQAKPISAQECLTAKGIQAESSYAVKVRPDGGYRLVTGTLTDFAETVGLVTQQDFGSGPAGAYFLVDKNTYWPNENGATLKSPITVVGQYVDNAKATTALGQEITVIRLRAICVMPN